MDKTIPPPISNIDSDSESISGSDSESDSDSYYSVKEWEGPDESLDIDFNIE